MRLHRLTMLTPTPSVRQLAHRRSPVCQASQPYCRERYCLVQRFFGKIFTMSVTRRTRRAKHNAKCEICPYGHMKEERNYEEYSEWSVLCRFARRLRAVRFRRHHDDEGYDQ